MYRFDRDLLIIDTETTGLEDHHVICQWGSILLDRNTLEPKSKFGTNVLITTNDLALASPEAMTIHGIAGSLLTNPKQASPIKEVISSIKLHHGPSTNYHIYGANVHFDWLKLKKTCSRWKEEFPFSGSPPTSCRVFDIASFLHILSASLGYGWGNCGTRAMCDRFYIPYPEHHNALGDCELLTDIIRKASERLQVASGYIPRDTQPLCVCGRAMQLRIGKNNKRFWGCSGYASGACKKTREYVNE